MLLYKDDEAKARQVKPHRFRPTPLFHLRHKHPLIPVLTSKNQTLSPEPCSNPAPKRNESQVGLYISSRNALHEILAFKSRRFLLRHAETSTQVEADDHANSAAKMSATIAHDAHQQSTELPKLSSPPHLKRRSQSMELEKKQTEENIGFCVSYMNLLKEPGKTTEFAASVKFPRIRKSPRKKRRILSKYDLALDPEESRAHRRVHVYAVPARNAKKYYGVPEKDVRFKETVNKASLPDVKDRFFVETVEGIRRKKMSIENPILIRVQKKIHKYRSAELLLLNYNNNLS